MKRQNTIGRRWLCAALCLLMTILLAVPMGTVAEEGSGLLYVVNPNPIDRLNLRKEPNTTAEILGRFYTGTVVEVLGTAGDFTQVRIGPNTGYMQSSFLSATRTDLEPGIWLTINVGTKNEKLHMRTQAQDGALSLGMYNNGTTVQYLEDAGDYFKVRAYDQDGFMLKSFLQVDSDAGKPLYTNLTVGRVDADALNLRGFPSRDALSLGTYEKGQMVDILATVGVWYYVEIAGETLSAAERQRGFMLSQYLTVGNYGETVADGTQMAVVKNGSEGERLHMRASPSWSSETVATYFNTTQVLALDTLPETGPNPTWVRVRVSELEGYMQGEFLGLIRTTAPDTWPEVEAAGTATP